VGVEDLIIDRLAAAKHWKSTRGEEQARALFHVFAKQMDMKYLRKRATEEKVDLPGPNKKHASVPEMKRLLDRMRAEDA
jgi:hypothetical protein